MAAHLKVLCRVWKIMLLELLEDDTDEEELCVAAAADIVNTATNTAFRLMQKKKTVQSTCTHSEDQMAHSS
jgi:hypothetical protein